MALLYSGRQLIDGMFNCKSASTVIKSLFTRHYRYGHSVGFRVGLAMNGSALLRKAAHRWNVYVPIMILICQYCDREFVYFLIHVL